MTMSKSTNKKDNRRSFVSNTRKAITAICAARNKRVQAHQPTIDKTLLNVEPIIQNQSRSTRMNARDAQTTTQQSSSLGAQMDTNQVGNDVETMMSTYVSPTQAELPKANTRGKSKGLNSDKLYEFLGKKLPITIEPDEGRPTGDYAQMFSSEIGIIVRSHAPLDVEFWKDVQPADFSKLVARLSGKFDFDMTQPKVDTFVRVTFAKAFYSFRYALKKHFNKFLTKEEALENRHKQVRSDEYWAFLCDHFSSENFKTRSSTNSINRSKLEVHHITGSMSFLSHAAKRGLLLGSIECFESQYKSKSKGWDPGAKEKWEEMISLRNEMTKEDGTCSMTEEEIVKQVLGGKSGYIKGSGYGPKPTSTKSSHSSFQEVQKKNKALEEKVQAQADEIKALAEQTKEITKFMETFKNPPT